MRRWFATAAVLLFFGAPSLPAKGITKRVTVSGGGLAAPLEIRAPEALANVWAGSFLGPPAGAPTLSGPRYRVAFYVQPPRGTETRLMYVVWFARDPLARDRGFVYLPGPREPWFRLNAGTIERPHQDGKWHEATLPWTRALTEALDRALASDASAQRGVSCEVTLGVGGSGVGN